MSLRRSSAPFTGQLSAGAQDAATWAGASAIRDATQADAAAMAPTLAALDAYKKDAAAGGRTWRLAATLRPTWRPRRAEAR